MARHLCHLAACDHCIRFAQARPALHLHRPLRHRCVEEYMPAAERDVYALRAIVCVEHRPCTLVAKCLHAVSCMPIKWCTLPWGSMTSLLPGECSSACSNAWHSSIVAFTTRKPCPCCRREPRRPSQASGSQAAAALQASTQPWQPKLPWRRTLDYAPAVVAARTPFYDTSCLSSWQSCDKVVT